MRGLSWISYASDYKTSICEFQDFGCYLMPGGIIQINGPYLPAI
ncbi:hypothetical protein ACX0G7_10120 [Flavitalea antarctica]